MRPVVLALLALMPQEDVSREALKGYAHPWDGFGVGSNIRVSNTSQEAVYDKDRKKMVWKDVVHDRTYTVEKIEKGQIWVRPAQFGIGDLPCDIYSVGLPAEMNGKGAAKGDDDLLIEGKVYACKLYEIQSETAIVRIWKSADVPGWAAKLLVVVDAKSGARREEAACVSLADKLTIGEKEHVCAVFESTVESGDTKYVIKEWRTDGVPGRVAKRETRVIRNNAEEKHLKQTLVVTSYEIKK